MDGVTTSAPVDDKVSSTLGKNPHDWFSTPNLFVSSGWRLMAKVDKKLKSWFMGWRLNQSITLA